MTGLYAGRFLTGIVSGIVFSIGTAWVQGLSTDAAELSPAEWMLLLASSGFEALLVGLVEPVLAAVDEVGIGAGAQLQAP